MAQFLSREVARATLLDRLTDLQPELAKEAKPLRTLDRYQLRQSVRRELERLLNTRCSHPLERVEEMGRSVVNYGMPDFSHFSPRNPDERKILEREVARVIEAFEPRFQDVQVVVEEYRENQKALMAHVNAIIVVESIRDPVSFPFVIQLKDRDFDINAIR
jgi:type VI secretion system protein ImpF